MYNYSELKEVVDKAIIHLSYNTEASRMIEPVRYILSIGGKRLRPVLALTACNLFCDKIDDAILPATGLEVFHNFTLVHDDIMDNASMRRNYPTVHEKWNLNQAILSGDVMAFIAIDCFLKTSSENLIKALKVFNKTAVDVCAGQQIDMDFEKSSHVSIEEYIRMIELKTASLISASARIGGIIGGAEEQDAECLAEFGKYLGLAFQVQDDLLDIWGDTRSFGKKPGGDIVANKKTFPYLKALEKASGKQQKQLQDLYSEEKIDPDIKVKEVIAIYDHLKVKEEAESLANEYIDNAFRYIQKISGEGLRKKELTSLASSLIGRER